LPTSSSAPASAATTCRLSPWKSQKTLSDGLKREIQVQVPAADLEAPLASAGRAQGSRALRGFRPGKVPVTHLKKIYGKAVMAETIEGGDPRAPTLKIVSDRGLKLPYPGHASDPRERVEKVIGGQSDSRLYAAAGDLPKIELARFQGHQARAPGGRGYGRRDQRGTGPDRRAEPARSPPRGRVAKVEKATASSSTSPARSTAPRSRGAPRRCRRQCRLGQPLSRLRDQLMVWR